MVVLRERLKCGSAAVSDSSVLKSGACARPEMSTPAMVVSALVRLMVISLGVFWVVSFLVSRLFVFYESYTLFLGTIKDERWLLEQC